jgi:hypothetical protein
MKVHFIFLRTDLCKIVPRGLALHYERLGLGYILGIAT